MELYTTTAQAVSRLVMQRYSTSFSLSTRLFPGTVRSHVYAIYGLVRIADEIVDTYLGDDASIHLEHLEQDVSLALQAGYSSNPIVHSFALTARLFNFDPTLLTAFFASMRLDLSPQHYDQALYERYIYGSAEVIGLMCLKVYCDGDDAAYESLGSGAKSLGSAYQKINFLRDLADDSHSLGRFYFPDYSFDSFGESAKNAVIADIKRDLDRSRSALAALPMGARRATHVSTVYYGALLRKLARTPIATIKTSRVRLGGTYKIGLLIGVLSGVVR